MDGSEGGARALQYARERAKFDGAKLIVTHVIEWSPYSFNTPEENAERHKRREQEIERAKAGVVEPAAALLRADGIEHETVVTHGPPAETLIKLAEKYSVQHIFIGRRGQSGIESLFFAFSTMISWSYYGLKGWTYLFGEGHMGQTLYKLIFCAFVALECMVQLGPILDISDALVFLICVPNILALYFLAPIVRREMQN